MKKIIVLTLVLALLVLVKIGSAQTREQTTIQTATADIGAVKEAVTVDYLNYPWGEVTFSYIEHGTKDSYYGERDWAFAQLDTKSALTMDGTKINPGQYALVISPGGGSKPMTLSVIQFDGPTFLKAGNVFAPAPKGTSIYSQPVSFQTVDATVDHMKIDIAPTAQGCDLVVNYGNRRLVKSFAK